MNYQELLSKKKFIDSLEQIEKDLCVINNKFDCENYVSEVELFADDLYNEEKISYEEYDKFLDDLWKVSNNNLSNFNSDNVRLSDTLNMRKINSNLEINDVVTFKKYNSYEIPRPYKVIGINDSVCLLKDLEGKKFKTKINYLDKRDQLYAEENFGKSFKE